ncbi:hypothetical protein H072_11356 [Dactylellina haptotyla CBS 200.50]|uniref:Uncharacterized protein n=1 Tax=Dactylellina haptotyla (strain CBS 200.50) TaxID=1284197 RepID=S8A2A1_DACHA|nr:hypothetical protein H072_11356 [Dactylellina haptotyla CBS 200.50]
MAKNNTGTLLPTSGAIREVNGKLCGVDLHGNFDVPLPGERSSSVTTVCRIPMPPLTDEIPPLSITHSNTARNSSISLSLGNKDQPEIGGQVSGRSSIYSNKPDTESNYSDRHSSVDTVKDSIRTHSARGQLFSELSGTLNTDVNSFGSEYRQLVYDCLPIAPTTDDKSFRWSQRDINPQRGVMSGVNEFGDSVYDTSNVERHDSVATSSFTSRTNRISIDTSAAGAPTVTNPSSPGSGIFTKSYECPAPNSMLSIRNKLVSGLLSDDELSDHSDELDTPKRSNGYLVNDARKPEGTILSRISSVESPLQEQDPAGLRECIGGNKPARQVRFDGIDDHFNEIEIQQRSGSAESEQSVDIESWRSQVNGSVLADTTQDNSKNQQLKYHDRSASLLDARISSLEPHGAGLKRLSKPVRRRCGQDSLSGITNQGQNDSTTVSGYVKDSLLEDQVRKYKAEAEAAQTKVSFFQTIIQRTSQRFVDMQIENEELHRQITDLRDHQNLLYDALGTKPVHNKPHMQLSDEQYDRMFEENGILKDQIKRLARELAGAEEEMRVFVDHLRGKKSAKGDQIMARFALEALLNSNSSTNSTEAAEITLPPSKTENERLALLDLQHQAQNLAMANEWDFSSDSEDANLLQTVHASKFAPVDEFDGSTVAEDSSRQDQQLPFSNELGATAGQFAFEANNPGTAFMPQGQSGAGFGNTLNFGQPSTSTGFGGFGKTNAGNQSIFNQPDGDTANPFAPKPKTTGFGNSSGGFGSQQQGGFGVQNSGFGFGNSNQPAFAFGQPTSLGMKPAFGGFGGFGSHNTRGFGNQASIGGLQNENTRGFGQPNTPAFGSQSNALVFGQPVPSAFGKQPTNVFGQTSSNDHGSNRTDSPPSTMTFRIGGKLFRADPTVPASPSQPEVMAFKVGGKTFTADRSGSPVETNHYDSPCPPAKALTQELPKGPSNILAGGKEGPKSAFSAAPTPIKKGQGKQNFMDPAVLEKAWLSTTGTEVERIQQMFKIFVQDAYDQTKAFVTGQNDDYIKDLDAEAQKTLQKKRETWKEKVARKSGKQAAFHPAQQLQNYQTPKKKQTHQPQERTKSLAERVPERKSSAHSGKKPKVNAINQTSSPQTPTPQYNLRSQKKDQTPESPLPKKSAQQPQTSKGPPKQPQPAKGPAQQLQTSKAPGNEQLQALKGPTAKQQKNFNHHPPVKQAPVQNSAFTLDSRNSIATKGEKQHESNKPFGTSTSCGFTASPMEVVGTKPSGLGSSRWANATSIAKPEIAKILPTSQTQQIYNNLLAKLNKLTRESQHHTILHVEGRASESGIHTDRCDGFNCEALRKVAHIAKEIKVLQDGVTILERKYILEDPRLSSFGNLAIGERK